MANNDQISEKLKSVRTMEDIVNLLSILFTNLNNQSEQYYDMFWNPVPMDLDLEKYDENGKLIVVQHPNVAKMRITAYSGPSDPNGVQEASVGALYINTSSRDIFYKAVGDDAFGWQKIWTTSNLVAGTNYLTPTGIGSGLRDLDADKITRGILDVDRGGTGDNGSITGLVKGNGTNPYTQAVEDVDYLSPSMYVGLIMTCPMSEIPVGWLVCNGGSYLKTAYPRLYNKIGDKYKLSEDPEDEFRVPNLIGRYVKYGNPEDVGTQGSAHVGAHGHTATTTANGEHWHSLHAGQTGTPNTDGHTDDNKYKKGSIVIKGSFKTRNDDEPFTNADKMISQSGALTLANKVSNGGSSTGSGSGYLGMDFDTNRKNSWSGQMQITGTHKHTITVASGGSGTNDVDHIVMVPVIKY